MTFLIFSKFASKPRAQKSVSRTLRYSFSHALMLEMVRYIYIVYIKGRDVYNIGSNISLLKRTMNNNMR